jgi:peptidoglycan hydrolase CwlO-like protein
MNAQFILLAQSVTTAVIEIILLLLGAAAIGFLTAWYFQKNHYVPIVRRLEEEKADLITQVNNLRSETGRLNEKINGLEKSVAEKEKSITGLKKDMDDLKKEIAEIKSKK